nr:helix-turn-helix domain-containing protein [Oscillibacter sp.]
MNRIVEILAFKKGLTIMVQTIAQKDSRNYECRTLRVEDIQNILGIGRSQAYSMVNHAADHGEPFRVIRVGSALLISKKSFDEYLDVHGL